MPTIVVVGKGLADGVVEVRDRASGDRVEVPVGDAAGCRARAGAGVSAAVEAVIFDWGGTLTPWHQIDFRDQWLSYARHHARASDRTPEEALELAERIMANEREAWLRIRGDGGSARMAEILAAAGHRLRRPGALGRAGGVRGVLGAAHADRPCRCGRCGKACGTGEFGSGC